MTTPSASLPFDLDAAGSGAAPLTFPRETGPVLRDARLKKHDDDAEAEEEAEEDEEMAEVAEEARDNS